MLIRPEREGDEDAIRIVTKAAFRDAPHSDHNEAEIVAALREARALCISLVATKEGVIVGHVAFSPVTINGAEQDWYGLGPVSVTPSLQGQGIGSTLINDGLARIRASSARGCVVLGDPDYYCRFGFAAYERLTFPDVPSECFRALSFGEAVPGGVVTYQQSFTRA